ncbi:hypothetical protein V6R21_11565 [Limibacter armeniacum]|uniref:hypothetical protein n=1 Tax=Limibacter armeniacum TaxID=466084 RepID=UPI002FE65158
MNPYLDMIPDRFKEKEIQGDYSSATISISHPVEIESKLRIDSKKGIILIQYKEITTTYHCNIFNYRKQISKVWEDTVRLIHVDKTELKKTTLSVNQYVLTFCEPSTGIILEIETMKRRIGWGEIYKVFPTKESAIKYAELLIRNRDIECTLLDSQYQYLQSIAR